MSWPSQNNGTISNSMNSLSRSGVATGIPSSGTIADNGALTLTTAMARVFAEGIYLYFPAGAVFAGSAAGLYFTVMSSTTAGVVYNNVYVIGDATIPASPTAIAATGPGAYAQVATEIQLRQVTIPAGMMGANGSLRASYRASYPNNTNVKTIRLKLGGTIIFNRDRIINNITEGNVLYLMNRGRLDRQIEITGMQSAGNAFGNSTSAATNHSINMSVDQVFSITGQIAVGADYFISEALQLEVQ